MKLQHILIVDDNEANLYLLQALLQGHGYEVVEARHGAEALEKARQNLPDLVITDVLMPVMDGFTLCREWKKDEHLRQIPFIFYTATYTDERDREFARSLGADAFIVKPKEPDVFLAMLKETVLRVESEAAARGPVAPDLLAEDESVLLKQYSEALIRKLEAKMEQLEQANRALQQEIAERRRLEEEALRMAQEWETTFDATNDTVWIIDKDYRIQRANEAAAKVFQRPRAELLGKHCWEVVHGAEWPIPECPSVRAEISRQREMLEIRTDDRFVQVTVDPLINATGQFDGAVHIISDITDRKRAELNLMASQKRFEDVALSSGDWIWEVDAEGRYIYTSGRVEQILGYTPVELIGKTPFDMMPEDEARRVGEIFRGIASRREPIVDLENWNLTKTGERVCLLTNGAPVLDNEGNLVGYRGVDKDITERKRAEEALRQQNSFRNTIIHRMAEGLCVCHRTSEYPYVRFTVWNDRMTEITGYTMEKSTAWGGIK